MRMACKRFARLGNGFSKTLDNHAAAVSLHIAFYNLVRVHESLRSTPRWRSVSQIARGRLVTCWTPLWQRSR
jgi:hypothetical protein